MFNSKILKIILVVILCLLLSSVSAFAQTETVTLQINGVYFEPKDVNGEIVEPFIITGIW